MKKILLVALSAFALSMVLPQTATATEYQSIVMPDKHFTKQEKKGIKLIEKIYKKYWNKWADNNDTGFLSIMTTKCANKLYALNPLNGTGYALWMFWPQSIDDSAGAFIDRSIVPSGNGWFRVTTRHSNKTTVIRVRVIESNGDLKIDDVTEK